MKCFKKWINLALAACIVLSLAGGPAVIKARAEGDVQTGEEVQTEEEAVSQEPARLMQSFVRENIVRAYIRNGALDGTSTYQIGKTACEDIRSCGIGEDSSPVRTLILLDNSMSMTQSLRQPILDTIKQIIDAHGENEYFRIGTVEKTVTYLNGDFINDYKSLINTVDSIKFNDQDTNLYNVLYDIISELEANSYDGYVRILVFADGVDNTEIGYTESELVDHMSSRNYPIYSFGVKTKSNAKLLENMFALSRRTAGDYLVIDKDSIGEVPAIVAADSAITVVTTTIPEEAKDGERKNSRLTLASGSSVEFMVQTPFSLEPVIVDPPEPPRPEEPVIEPDPTIWDRLKEPKVIAALVGAVIVLAGLMWLLIYNLAFKNKKQPENVMMPTINLAAGAGETELFGYGTGSQNNGTEQLTPSVSDGRKKYMFLMTDTEDEDRSFRCELIDEVTIGRMEDNYIIIGDDNSVHRHHSVVSVKNGTFYYTDLKDVKNRSAINGVLLKPTIPQLIVSNSVVTIGRHSYTITISEGR